MRPPSLDSLLALPSVHALAGCLEGRATVRIAPCRSQIGSGALPIDHVASTALVVTRYENGRPAGAALQRLEPTFRSLPAPVIGRLRNGALWLDPRCLEDERGFVAQLRHLGLNT